MENFGKELVGGSFLYFVLMYKGTIDAHYAPVGAFNIIMPKPTETSVGPIYCGRKELFSICGEFEYSPIKIIGEYSYSIIFGQSFKWLTKKGFEAHVEILN
jgi:hypothetical protein